MRKESKQSLGTRLPVAGVKIPKIGNPATPEKGVPSQKNRIFPVVPCKEMGILGDFDPCARGKRIPKILADF